MSIDTTWSSTELTTPKQSSIYSVNSLDSSSNTSSLEAPLEVNLLASLAHIEDQFTSFINQTNFETLSNDLSLSFKKAIFESPITMIPTYNINPTGREYGNYLVIDVGGSTLRVAVVALNNSNTEIIISKKWSIKDDFKLIDYSFFNWIGAKIHEVLSEQKRIRMNDQIIHTGLTWSFPIKQTTKKNGLIQQISKGYTILPEIENTDLKELIENACSNYNLNVEIDSIINDSIAVYISGAYYDSLTKVAIVLGTGVNGCLSIPASLLNPEKRISLDSADNKVLMNTELSIFGNCFLKFANKYDRMIDTRFGLSHEHEFHMNLDNGVFQPIEMMSSGRYISELIRLVMVDLIERKQIFNGQLPYDFDNYELSGELICQLSESHDLAYCKKIFLQKFPKDINGLPLLLLDSDIIIIRKLVDYIITRGAFIVSISIISLTKLLNLKEIERETNILNVSYVGSFLQNFDSYRIKIENYLASEFENGNLPKINLKFVDNSSVIGAAVGAAVNRSDMML